MREQQTGLAAADLLVFVVTFESARRVAEYQAREPVAFPILRDPRREAYRSFGLARSRRRALAARATNWYYVRQAMRGRLPWLRASDYLQLGGDVLLSATGEPCWIYASREPADRPSIAEVVHAVETCRDDG